MTAGLALLLALAATLHGASVPCEAAQDETPNVDAPAHQYEGTPRNRQERRAARKERHA